MSPYGYYQSAWGGQQRPQPGYHAQSIHQTIALNNSLNAEAQASVDAREPRVNIWDDGALDAAMSQLNIAAANNKKRPIKASDKKLPDNFDLVLDPGYEFTNLCGLRWDAAHETATIDLSIVRGPLVRVDSVVVTGIPVWVPTGGMNFSAVS